MDLGGDRHSPPRKEIIMKSVSLKQIVDKCIQEPAFFRALLKNPEKTLLRHKMQISTKDLEKLKELSADKKAMKDFPIYASLVRKYARTSQGILW
jgi:hypothetical protein